MFAEKHVLVTGGAGAIGSRLVAKVLEEGAEKVAVVDDLSSGYPWLLPEDSRVHLIVDDVCNLQSLRLNLREPIVFHLAAFFANQNSVDHPLDDLHTNGQGTLTTLMWAARNHAERVVYASAGCSIAGHNIDAPIQEDMPVSLNLDTPYQITKALGEFYCNYFDRFVSAVRCRFFNSYGPGEIPGRYRNVIPNFIWRALRGEPLTITGSGHETRDFIHVDDLVQGLMLSATKANAGGGAFNLGTGVQTEILTLAQTIVAACASSSPIEFAPRRDWDHSLRRSANIEKARGELGFNPSVTVPEGIARTVEWFQKNYDRIEQSVEGSKDTPMEAIVKAMVAQ